MYTLHTRHMVQPTAPDHQQIQLQTHNGLHSLPIRPNWPPLDPESEHPIYRPHLQLQLGSTAASVPLLSGFHAPLPIAMPPRGGSRLHLPHRWSRAATPPRRFKLVTFRCLICRFGPCDTSQYVCRLSKEVVPWTHLLRRWIATIIWPLHLYLDD
jgi:hypothetical protein